MPPFVVVAILVSTLVSAIAQFSLRKAATLVGPISTLLDKPLTFGFTLMTNPYFLFGLVCYALSLCAWMVVLSRLQVSLAYPFSSIGFVFAALIGYVFFGEQVSLLRLSGILVTCLGLVLLSRSA